MFEFGVYVTMYDNTSALMNSVCNIHFLKKLSPLFEIENWDNKKQEILSMWCDFMLSYAPQNVRLTKCAGEELKIC